MSKKKGVNTLETSFKSKILSNKRKNKLANNSAIKKLSCKDTSPKTDHLKEAVKIKRINELISAKNTDELIEVYEKKGIEYLVALINAVAKTILKASALIAAKLFILFIPILILFAPVIFLLIVVSLFAGNDSINNKNLNSSLSYVSYNQGDYQEVYGESGWCGITAYADIFKSLGYDIDPIDIVKYADDNGLSILSENGTHLINYNWFNSFAKTKGMIYEEVYKGDDILSWTNEKLSNGYYVVVCFDSGAKYDSGYYITLNKHYIWLAKKVGNKYAAIDPAGGRADKTYFPKANAKLGNYIVDESEIINHTGKTNNIVGFALKNETK